MEKTAKKKTHTPMEAKQYEQYATKENLIYL